MLDASALRLLLAEIVHRTANDFAVAHAEVYLAARAASLSFARPRLAALTQRLHALASIQRLLQPPSQPSIDLGNRLCELCHHHAEARFAEQGAFIRLQTCEVFMEAERGWALLMIVSELLTNAARHAFNQPGGLVQVEVSSADDVVLCRLQDNGVGSARNQANRGTGTALVEELARRANITLAPFACEQGTGIELHVPLSETPVQPKEEARWPAM
ncbi:ATP-binding protein [Sphingomonas trueperi]|uniref:ATP-binding protein n=1 Tax=Sphingomonas trueperi TaxID=53317 RepID=UPI000F1A0683